MLWLKVADSCEQIIITNLYCHSDSADKFQIVSSPGLEIAGAKAQICVRKAAHCARVCHRIVYKNIERVKRPAKLS